ncbi:MSMEG_1061 family FMN-dependent PPOX-type flavoprotein [Nocardioides sp. L-11A]|uniref:MSMEG_1061 family FMN-dependent PPOX-type flavoprotein n=1 Tax=Nocardioides sp. L-11A TaxID=3043848 RepID=UPI002499D3D7|nr:pyridoxamine 5'-phosphate oxidase family protein [Nocardioides sp. L-11A]
MTVRTRPRRVDLARVRELVGHPDPAIEAKVLDHLDPYCQLFVAHSPYCVLATVGPDGLADCSPRGDDPGFVRVLDERTLVLPDRPGNQLAESFTNICHDPAIGMLFLVPGYAETLRVNGRAYPSDDPQLMPMLEARGRVPSLATVIEVEQAYLHCGKANLRGGLWESERQELAALLPSGGVIAAAHIGMEGITAALLEDDLADDYQRNL